MPLALNGGDFGKGIAFVIGAASMAEFIAKACSSPQTVEINANKRAETMMKWVAVGLVEGALIIGVTVFFDKKYSGALIAGAAVEGCGAYPDDGSPDHAVSESGAASAAPDTRETAQGFSRG